MRIGMMSLGALLSVMVLFGGTYAEASTQGKTKTTPTTTVSGTVATTFQMPWQIGVFQ